jgi:hypothetical protein
MKTIKFLTLFVCLSPFTLFAQNSLGISKEKVCKAAAISIVGNVKPMLDAGISKNEIVTLGKDLVKDVIKDAPGKAYDLLKQNYSRDQVIETLYNDFMKLDDSVVAKFLLKMKKGTLEDEDEDDEFEEDK